MYIFVYQGSEFPDLFSNLPSPRIALAKTNLNTTSEAFTIGMSTYFRKMLLHDNFLFLKENDLSVNVDLLEVGIDGNLSVQPNLTIHTSYSMYLLFLHV